MIDFEFACRDDCLEHMIPSDLRQSVSERDQLSKLIIQYRTAPNTVVGRDVDKVLSTFKGINLT